MAQFLFVVRVPEVEPYVAQLRERFDPAAKRGLGAHVTVLHSTVPPGRIDPTVIGRVAAAVSSIAHFRYQVTRVARFPGTLYLVAEPAAPFLLLSDRLAVALPMAEPAEQKRKALVPHISVVRKNTIDDREVEAELTMMLERHGPISCACTAIVLLENSTAMWRSVREFVLSGGRGSPAPGPS